MKPNPDNPSDRQRAADLRRNTGKLVLDGVVTHERLLRMMKERNPIIARRDDRSERASR